MSTKRFLEDPLLPHLDTFARAAELCSFTGAGRELGMTQAAVSQRMHALEKRVRVALFDRQGGGVLLTDAGRTLYEYAQKILALHHEAQAKLAGQAPVDRGLLLLGASTVPGEHLLPKLLGEFHRAYPEIQVKVEIGDSVDVLERVEKGQVNLGVVGRKSDSPHLEFRHFATDRMVLVVPKTHAWATKKKVPLEQLCREPIVLREPGSGMRHSFERALTRANKGLGDLQIALELGSNEAIKRAVLSGAGVAMLSRHAVEEELESGKLHEVGVEDLQCDREMFLVWDKRRVAAAPARIFRVYLERIAATR